MDNDAKQSDYEIVRKARQLKKALLPSNGSLATKNAYDREFKRLIADGAAKTPALVFAAICDTRSKRTYFRRLAAAKHVVQTSLTALLAKQDRQQIDGDVTGWKATLRVIEFLIGLHEIFEQNRGICPIVDPRPRRSKRRTLKTLPPDFRERIFAAMGTSKYRLPTLVSALTGCRPAELEKGIEITLSATEVTLTVRGVKIKGSLQGQEWRSVTYSIESEHPLVVALIREMNQQEVLKSIVQVSSKVNFTSALRRTGRALWPKNAHEVTSYTFRHQAASDFKANMSSEEVSMALGHAVDRTASVYGQYQIARGSGMLQPTAVRSASSIKPTRSAKLGNMQRKQT